VRPCIWWAAATATAAPAEKTPLISLLFMLICFLFSHRLAICCLPCEYLVQVKILLPADVAYHLTPFVCNKVCWSVPIGPTVTTNVTVRLYVVFIYTVPGYNCPVKERMLYSTCKSPLLETVEKEFGLEIARQIELDEPHDLTSDFLYNELHPPTNIVRQQFAKPRPPAGCGPKRLVRNTE
jgi:hypothetical protein